MEIEALLKEITGIFRKVLDNDSVVLQQETTANDIEEWDSLTHVQLIVALEQHFNIRFTSLEIQKFKNVGDLCRAINAKVG
jgi:acyl carrier protein